MIHKILITDELKAQAEAAEKEYLEYWEKKKKKNFTGLEAPRRSFTGFVCEFAFDEFLRGNRILFKTNPRKYNDFKPKDYYYDHVVYNMDGLPFLIDVKGGSQRRQTMLVGLYTFTRRHSDIFVGAKINFCEVEFHGQLTAARVKRPEFIKKPGEGEVSRMFKGACYQHDLAALDPLELIIDNAKKI